MNPLLTYLNYFAFTLYLADARQRDTIPPAWLVTSEQARQPWIETARNQLKGALSQAGCMITDDFAIENYMAKVPSIRNARQAWIEHESTLEQERIVNKNPQAFFIHAK